VKYSSVEAMQKLNTRGGIQKIYKDTVGKATIENMSGKTPRSLKV
jgi:hypothetical protein